MTEESPTAGGAAGITDHELAALADLEPTLQAHRVLRAIGIERLLESRTALRAGYSTLLVRDIAGLDGHEIVAQGFGAAMSTIMVTAEDILRLVVTRDIRSVARTVLVKAELGSFLLDMTGFGVHAAQPLHGSTDLLELVAGIIEELACGACAELPTDVEVARFPVEGDVRAVSFVIESPDSWRLPNSDAESRASVWEKVVAGLGASDGEAARAPRRAL